MADGLPPGVSPPQQQLRLDEVQVHVTPVSGAVGKTEDGQTVLAFDAMVMLKIEVVLPEHAKKALQRGLVSGIEVVGASEMPRG